MQFKKVKKNKPFFPRIKAYGKDLFLRLKGMDRINLILVLILFAIGLIMIYSITSISIYNGVKGDPSNYFIKTAIMGVIGMVAMLFVMMLPYQWLKNLSFAAAVLCPFILAFTLMFADGSGSSNVRSWFKIGSFQLQPAEFVKVGLILSVAWLVDYDMRMKKYYLRNYKQLIKEPSRILQSFTGVILYIGLCAGLVAIQPDFGSGLIIGLIGVVMFFSTGLPLRLLKPIFGIMAIVLAIGAIIMGTTFAYQLDRLAVWLDPFNHVKGFQNVMGYTAIALGGMTGVGVGKSTQKYGYVLEPHNDMISTILAEELGVWMVLAIMVIYFVIAMRCFKTAIKCKDIYASLVAIGVGSIFLIQPIVNLGGASGAIPLTGVTLPFISYGGSSLISLFIGIGVYLNISMECVAASNRRMKRREQSIKEKVVPFIKNER